MVATGVNADGYSEILGIATSTADSGTGWNTFFKDLVARGLNGVALVTSDAHTGLVDAIGANLPRATWQRCRTHYTASLMSVCPKHTWGGVKAMLRSVFHHLDADAVHAQYDKLLEQIETSLPDVHAHLDRARNGVLAVSAFPRAVWRQIWSNNPNERLNREIRRCTDVVGISPGPNLDDPARGRGAGRAARRMRRRPPRPRTRRPQQEPPRPNHPRPQRGQGRHRTRHPLGAICA